MKNMIKINKRALTSPSLPLLPEVRQEALQVVGVAQLVLALVGSAHQAAPRRVELGALLLDVVHGLRVGLDQPLCRLAQGVNLAWHDVC